MGLDDSNEKLALRRTRSGIPAQARLPLAHLWFLATLAALVILAPRCSAGTRAAPNENPQPFGRQSDRSPNREQLSATVDGENVPEEAAPETPFSPVLFELAAVIGVAIAGRWLADQFGQSAVLGELLVGILLGNIGVWLGSSFFVLVMHLGEATSLFSEVWLTGRSVAEAAGEIFDTSQLAASGSANQLIGVMTGPLGPRYVVMGFALWLFSELGVILLLFMVGLESRVDEMLQVGRRALSWPF